MYCTADSAPFLTCVWETLTERHTKHGQYSSGMPACAHVRFRDRGLKRVEPCDWFQVGGWSLNDDKCKNVAWKSRCEVMIPVFCLKFSNLSAYRSLNQDGKVTDIIGSLSSSFPCSLPRISPNLAPWSPIIINIVSFRRFSSFRDLKYLTISLSAILNRVSSLWQRSERWTTPNFLLPG